LAAASQVARPGLSDAAEAPGSGSCIGVSGGWVLGRRASLGGCLDLCGHRAASRRQESSQRSRRLAPIRSLRGTQTQGSPAASHLARRLRLGGPWGGTSKRGFCQCELRPPHRPRISPLPPPTGAGDSAAGPVPGRPVWGGSGWPSLPKGEWRNSSISCAGGRPLSLCWLAAASAARRDRPALPPTSL
jgi:hypothetical protein